MTVLGSSFPKTDFVIETQEPIKFVFVPEILQTLIAPSFSSVFFRDRGDLKRDRNRFWRHSDLVWVVLGVCPGEGLYDRRLSESIEVVEVCSIHHWRDVGDYLNVGSREGRTNQSLDTSFHDLSDAIGDGGVGWRWCCCINGHVRVPLTLEWFLL